MVVRSLCIRRKDEKPGTQRTGSAGRGPMVGMEKSSHQNHLLGKYA